MCFFFNIASMFSLFSVFLCASFLFASLFFGLRFYWFDHCLLQTVKGIIFFSVYIYFFRCTIFVLYRYYKDLLLVLASIRLIKKNPLSIFFSYLHLCIYVCSSSVSLYIYLLVFIPNLRILALSTLIGGELVRSLQLFTRHHCIFQSLHSNLSSSSISSVES